MRFLLAAVLGAVLCAPAAHAEEPAGEASAAPGRLGYAFESPRMLAEQRLFGIAHGISLLAAACLDVPALAQDAQDAYAAWHARQQPTLDAVIADLTAYYLGDEAPAADWRFLAQTLRLRDALDYSPDSAELKAACATLAQALSRPLYDLAARLRLEEPMARIVAATEVEAHDRHCRDKFSGLARQVHEARYDVWREFNAPLVQQASATLESEWPEYAPAETFAAWLAGLRRETKVGGSLADCLDFSAALKRPGTALRNVFRMPPSLHGAQQK